MADGFGTLAQHFVSAGLVDEKNLEAAASLLETFLPLRSAKEEFAYLEEVITFHANHHFYNVLMIELGSFERQAKAKENSFGRLIRDKDVKEGSEKITAAVLQDLGVGYKTRLEFFLGEGENALIEWVFKRVYAALLNAANEFNTEVLNTNRISDGVTERFKAMNTPQGEELPAAIPFSGGMQGITLPSPK